MSAVPSWSDPRELPSETMAQEMAQEDNASLVADLERFLRQVEEQVEVFSTDGWHHVMAGYERELDSLNVAMSRETDQAMWKFLRGQAVAVESFLGLPGRMGQTRLRLLEEHRRLTATEVE